MNAHGCTERALQRQLASLKRALGASISAHRHTFFTQGRSTPAIALASENLAPLGAIWRPSRGRPRPSGARSRDLEPRELWGKSCEKLSMAKNTKFRFLAFPKKKNVKFQFWGSRIETFKSFNSGVPELKLSKILILGFPN